MSDKETTTRSTAEQIKDELCALQVIHATGHASLTEKFETIGERLDRLHADLLAVSETVNNMLAKTAAKPK